MTIFTLGKVKKLLNLSVLITAGFISQSVSAVVLNFDITYDGTNQIIDASSDPVQGASLAVGDSFNLDFHAANNDFWNVAANINSGLFLNFFVLDSVTRSANITTTFFLDGVQVGQDVDNPLNQSFVHAGAQNINFAAGFQFDQVVVDYTLLNAGATFTTIQGNGVHAGFSELVNNPGRFQYTAGPVGVPAPGPIALIGLGFLALGFVRSKQNSKSQNLGMGVIKLT